MQYLLAENLQNLTFFVCYQHIFLKKVEYFTGMLYNCFAISFCSFREKETSILKEQIEKLNSQIKKEEKRAEDLKIKAK